MSRHEADAKIVALRKQIADLQERLEHREARLAELDSTRHTALNQLSDALEALPVGIHVFDAEGRTILTNAVGRRYMRESIPSRNDPDRRRWATYDEKGNPVPPDQWPGARALRGERVDAGMEFSLRDQEGRLNWVLVSAVPYLIAELKTRGGIAVLQDITSRKSAEQALREANEQLRNTDRRKDRFLATLAHELRNPLAPLQSGLDLLRMAGDDAESRDSVLQLMNRQMTRVVRLVDDLLEASRFNQGKVRLDLELCDVRDIVYQALETSSSDNREQRRISFDVPEHAVLVRGDTVRLLQVFENLLSNARKYTSNNGQIFVGMELQDERVRIAVRDDGAGIASEDVEMMFEPFHQAEDGVHGGLGIGLTLVRELVHLHQGTIYGFSEGVGHGSEFVVTLPLADTSSFDESPQAHAEAVATVALATALQRVLVVDDNQDAADTLAMLLKAMGAAVETAYEGRSALQLLGEFRPHVVLLDIGMPEMDGYEVAAAIRAQRADDAPLLVAVTGWGNEADKARARAAGFDEHLTKPVVAETLLRILARG